MGGTRGRECDEREESACAGTHHRTVLALIRIGAIGRLDYSSEELGSDSSAGRWCDVRPRVAAPGSTHIPDSGSQ